MNILALPIELSPTERTNSSVLRPVWFELRTAWNCELNTGTTRRSSVTRWCSRLLWSCGTTKKKITENASAITAKNTSASLFPSERAGGSGSFIGL